MALTAREIAQYVDRKGLLYVEKLSFPISCSDAREVWGRLDVLVTPIDGVGQAWVTENRIVWEQ